MKQGKDSPGRRSKLAAALAVLALWLLIWSGCSAPVPAAASVPASTPSPALSPSGVVPAPSPSPSHTPTPVPSPVPEPTPAPEPTPFTFVWVTDTQLMTEGYPELLTQMFQWVGDHAQSQNFVALLHTGDLVQDCKKDFQWERIDDAFALLPRDMLVFSILGNHDQQNGCSDWSSYLAHRPDSSQAVLNQNGSAGYAACTFGGVDFLLLGIGYKHEKENLDWAREVIAQNPGRTGILLAHSYLSTSERALSSGGKILYRGLVQPEPSIRLVLSGHLPGTWRSQKKLTDELGDARSVWQLTYNPQHYPNGGNGYLRLMTFDPMARSIHVTTYSPILDDYDYFASVVDTFVLEDAF